jgi:hypothetical protein
VVDDGHEPERIEIELTSHEPASPGGRSRRAPGGVPDGASVEAGDPDDPGPGLLGTERGRLIAVAAATAALALVVGVLVGRLGSGDVASSEGTEASTADSTTTTRGPGNRDTLPRAPEILAPTTTRPERPTTTTIDPERMTEGSIQIHPDVPPDPVELVGLTVNGEMIRIDVTTGATVSTRVDGSVGGPPSVLAGRGWVLVPTFDPQVASDQEATVIYDDGSRSSVLVGAGWTGWPTFLASGNTTVWRIDSQEETGQPIRLVELTIDGSETGVTIELDGFYPQMTDPRGGVVVHAPGGYYVLGPDSRARLTSGQLIALGRRRAVVNECDDQLECGYFVVDRSTGARTSLILDPALGERPSIELGGWWSFREPMSPDEGALLVLTWDNSGGGRQAIGVLDLATGEHAEIGGSMDQPMQMEWSPDGQRVYWLDGGRLKVFERSTGESVLLSDDLDRLNALTLRPSSGAADGSG